MYFVLANPTVIIIFIQPINGRYQYKKCNKKTNLNKENNYVIQGHTQGHTYTGGLETVKQPRLK